MRHKLPSRLPIIYKFHRVKICSIRIGRRFYDSMRAAPDEACTTIQRLRENAHQIFHAGIDAVLPRQMIEDHLMVLDGGSLLKAGSRTYHLDHNVYVVGFGKAVGGMCRSVEDLVGRHVVTGVLSVPEGTIQLTRTASERLMLPGIESRIQMFEGARDNLPDHNAQVAANQIIQLARELTPKDLLVILISGGGSALLPAPIPPITLEEKSKIIHELSRRGASISELNSVRKRISLVKGGRLAQLARPAQVLSLILSDVIGDPLDLIASGPTTRNMDDPSLALAILRKYNITVPINVETVLRETSETGIDCGADGFEHVQNLLVGTNRQAIEKVLAEAHRLGYREISLTTSLQGEARDVGASLAGLAKLVCDSYCHHAHDWNVSSKSQMLGISGESLRVTLEQTLGVSSICLVTAGETVVKVQGNGKGGRNQELALAFALALDEKHLDKAWKVLLLSGGTDGIDGPTEAAGAVAWSDMASIARKRGLEPDVFLQANDSFGFFSAFNSGRDHIITGHTGTNVMDVQILLMCHTPKHTL